MLIKKLLVAAVKFVVQPPTEFVFKLMTNAPAVLNVPLDAALVVSLTVTVAPTRFVVLPDAPAFVA